MKKILVILYILSCPSIALFSQSPEPSNQPTNMSFSNIKPYSFTMSFTKTTADGYLTLKSDKPITDVPGDGITYQKGGGLGSCKVMAVGSSAIYLVNHEVVEGTKYYFKIFAYNGTGGGINYKQTNPLTDSVISTPAFYGGYYATVDSNSPTFISDLHNLINLHIQAAYGNYKYSIIPNIYERDTINGQMVVNCDYSDSITIYTPPFDFSLAGYSREHVTCQSWMPSYPFRSGILTDYPEGADYFNLLLTKQGVNSTRGDDPLGIVVTPTGTYNGYKRGYDSNGNIVFEPRDSRKGDAARCLMYQMVCYDGLYGGWAIKQLLSYGASQDQSVLKKWNYEDPPDKFERTRNEYVSTLQNNRNPFIDHPDWANCIDFDSLLKEASCAYISVNDIQAFNDLNLFPNPAMNVLNIEISTERPARAVFAVNDFSGRTVKEWNEKINGGRNQFPVDIRELKGGLYILKISIAGENIYRKFIVMH